jgi:hypothetical protein
LTTIPVHRDRATRRQQGRDGPRGDAAKTSPGTGYDLVTFFDCLHDMGDPVGAARHVCESLAPGGTWILVEPLAKRSHRGQLQPGGPPLLRGDPATQRLLGNFPQAFTHMGLINSARNLTRSGGPAEHRPDG